MQNKFRAKQNCRVSNANKTPITKVTERTKSSNFGLYLRLWLCDVIHKWRNKRSELKPELKRIYWYQIFFRSQKHNESYVKLRQSMTIVKNDALQHLGPKKNGKDVTA